MVGIIAGGGSLPAALRAHLGERGHAVRTIGIRGEVGPDAPCDAIVGIAEIEIVVREIERLGITHAVLIGGIAHRPRWQEGRIGWRSLPLVANVLRALPRGDDAMLRAVVQSFERIGVTVLGIHQIWPELLASAGALGALAPSRTALGEIDLALAAARVLGDLDVGQGAVAVGKRVIALEGLEGTDAMLERVASLRAAGRINVRSPSGVLVKVAKPAQEVRADLPTIGPDTVANAAAAGLRGIAIGACRALIVDRERTIADADAAGLFVWGIELD